MKLKYRLTGVAPLLMNNGRKSDPTDPWTKRLKEITTNKKKTEDDHLEIRRIEWFAGLYTDESGKKIVLPADLILGAVVQGAKKNKNGPEAKAGVFEHAPWFALKHDGPADVEKLYEAPGFCDYRGVRVGNKRVMRARPRFATWSVDIALMIDPEVIDAKLVTQALDRCGQLVGIGDYRPRFGRFTVESLK